MTITAVLPLVYCSVTHVVGTCYTGSIIIFIYHYNILKMYHVVYSSKRYHCKKKVY